MEKYLIEAHKILGFKKKRQHSYLQRNMEILFSPLRKAMDLKKVAVIIFRIC